jgi:alpha-galactosidase
VLAPLCLLPTDAVALGWQCVPSITSLQREILLNKEAIAINQDVTPAGRLLLAADKSAMVYARNLTGGDVAVALYNPTDVAADGQFDFASLGWSSGASASVRDLWAHKDLGAVTGRFPSSGSLPVEPHATVLLRLSPKTAPPLVEAQ